MAPIFLKTWPWYQSQFFTSKIFIHNLPGIMYTYYCDVLMGAMSSQIISLTIVYSTVYSVADRRKHQSSASLAFVRGIHRWPVSSPHKSQVTRKKFPIWWGYDDFGSTDQFHKSQNAPVAYPTMLHSEQKCTHFCSEWSVAGYGTGAFWDLWTRSIVPMSCWFISRVLRKSVRLLWWIWIKKHLNTQWIVIVTK